ncbi:MAG: tetratricopeptide repeat protein [Thermoanaerobaculia bacterium]
MSESPLSGGASRWSRVRELFEAWVDLPPAAQRERLLALERQDADLAREVRSLLEAEDAAGSTFLSDGAAARAEAMVAEIGAEPTGPPPIAPGDLFDDWRVVAPLGKGGMAEVWEAERADGQFEQRAAIKILKRGMDSEEILARFLTERQILARLDHPGIARLYDGGLAADGRPYFVLEKIDGEPITDYAERRDLAIGERIRLVVACCDAIAAAHRRLVVHRDLKPSNILVTADGEPKLLDFGIAKLLADGPENAARTRTEVRVLTPAYAAPEQILGEPVTTATDVYGIATVLYELLTGRLPHERRAAARSAAELASLVSTEVVERPSTAVGRQVSPTPEAAVVDARDRKRRARALRGDLDTVLLVALRREPERRYASIAAFAEDLERCLDGRPIRARSDSLAYRSRKFLVRHRYGVAAAALISLSAVLGLAGALSQARRAAAAAERSRLAAGRAALEAQRAERIQDFLVRLFEGADPHGAQAGQTTARELLARGATRIESELAAEPGVQSELLDTVARIEISLGLYDAAESHVRAALAKRRAAGAGGGGESRSLAVLGLLELQQGKLESAEKDLERAIAGMGRGAGPALAFDRARAMVDLSNVEYLRGRPERAVELLESARPAYVEKFGAQSAEVAEQLLNRGIVLSELGRIDEAFAAESRARAVFLAAMGPEHPSVANSDLCLAAVCEQRGDYAEAGRLYRESLAIRLKALGPDHPETGLSQSNLGRFLVARNELDEGESHAREAIRIFAAIDPRHFEATKAMNDLAIALLRRGRAREAETAYREVARRFEEALGPQHPFPWVARVGVGNALADQGRLAEAENELARTVERIAATGGPESEYLLRAWDALGDTLRRGKRLAEAEATHRRALALATRVLGELHPSTALAMHSLALDLAAGGEAQRAEAARLAARAVAVLVAKDPGNWRRQLFEATAKRLAGPPGPAG